MDSRLLRLYHRDNRIGTSQLQEKRKVHPTMQDTQHPTRNNGLQQKLTQGRPSRRKRIGKEAPKVPKKMKEALNAYNDIPIEDIAEYYSKFLQDNDYEFYMPFIHSHTIDDLKNAQKNLVKALWVRNRFTKYHSGEWKFYTKLTNEEYHKL